MTNLSSLHRRANNIVNLAHIALDIDRATKRPKITIHYFYLFYSSLIKCHLWLHEVLCARKLRQWRNLRVFVRPWHWKRTFCEIGIACFPTGQDDNDPSNHLWLEFYDCCIRWCLLLTVRHSVDLEIWDARTTKSRKYEKAVERLQEWRKKKPKIFTRTNWI